jgi:protein-S-isoprenylcysteine O-methyltransferase Ste14
MDNTTDYGLWPIVAFSSLMFLFLVCSFFKPRTRRDWRTFGAFSAFVVALFTEMYGFPLTIYLLSGWLGSRYPEIDWFSHNAGHLLQSLVGWGGDAHFGPIHLLSNILIIGGLFLLASSWKVLFRAQQNHELAHTGPYSKVRHPQYAAFTMILLGFLIQWPTLPTLIMFPVLVWMYHRLARREEQEAIKEFGVDYICYAEKTPRFFPRIGGGFGSKSSGKNKGGIEHANL